MPAQAEPFGSYGNDRPIQLQRSPVATFQYRTDARVVTFEELSQKPRLRLIDRVVRLINSAILQ